MILLKIKSDNQIVKNLIAQFSKIVHFYLNS